MPIDIRTVMLLYLIINIINAGAIAVIWKQNQGRFAGIIFLLVGLALQAAGPLLLVMRGLIPDLISMTGSNTIVLAGALIVFIGLERFTGKKGWQIHNYVLLAIFIVVSAYFVVVQPNLMARDIAVTAMIMTYTFQSCWLLLRRVGHGMLQITRLVGIVFACYAAFSFVRIILTFIFPYQSNDFFNSGIVNSVSMTTYSLLNICLTISLIIMVNRRLLIYVKAREVQLAEAQRVAHIGHWQLLDMNGSPQWSPEIFNIFGIDPVKGEPSFAAHRDLLHPDDWDILNNAISTASSKGETFDIEFRILRPDKSLRWLHSLGYAEKNHEGVTVRIFGTVQDITERKLAEELLLSEHLMLTRTEGIAHIGSWDWEIATDTVTWSDELFRIFQRYPQEGAPSFAEHPAFYHPDDMALLQQAVKAAIADGTPYELELRAIRKDGKTRVCLARGIPEMNQGGRVVKLTGSLQDITERRKAEKEITNLHNELNNVLGAAAEEWQLTFNSMKDVIMLLDVEGIVKQCNLATSKLLGKPPADIIGHSHQELIHGSSPATTENCAVMRIKQSLQRETQVISRDGKWFEDTVDPIIDENGNFTGIIHSMADITEYKQLEQKKDTTLEIVKLIGEPGDVRQIIRQLLIIIKDFSGCSAVGLRLKEGEDFPYFETNGFIPGHVKVENYLCAYDEKGELIRDSKGNPVLECMCGNIICGRFDPAKSFFTEGGSFCTNSTTELLATTTEEDRQTRTRNKCNGEGYESVALIPLKTRNGNIGLVQLNDHQRNRFTPELIKFYEGIAQSIGIVLAKKMAEDKLMKSEEKFAKAFDASPVIIALTKLDSGIVIDANEIFMHTYGYTRQEIIGHTTQELGIWVNADDRLHVIEELKKQGRITNREMNFRTRSGEIRTSLTSIEQIVIDNKPCILWVATDITERKQAQESLKYSEERYRTLFESSAEGILAASVKTRKFKYANPAMCKLLGYSEAELMQLSVNDIHPKDALDQVIIEFEALAKGIKTLASDLPFLKKDGTIVFVDVNTANVLIDGEECNVGFFTDVTERKQSEKDLLESRKQLEDLAQYLLDVREEERARIAHNIHDDMGQVITALQIDLAQLNKNISPEQQNITTKISGMSKMIKSLDDKMRETIADLRPSILDDLGLAAAIQWQLVRLKKNTGINYHLEILKDDLQLDTKISITLFRILQEALTNISKYAQAKEVKISLQQENNNLIMSISDNGIGINLEAFHSNKPFGLIGMKHRAKYAGGSLEITGVPNKGTTLLVTIPMSK